MKNNIFFDKRNAIHLVGAFVRYENARWSIGWMSVRIFMLVGITEIVAVLLIGIPLTANGMSSRPPLIPEQLEDGDYLQKSNIDSRKILIKDKNDHVKGYLQKSYMDHRKMLLLDKNGKVKGYLQRDPMDSRKLRFIKEGLIDEK